ncbi:MAG: type II secretion system F family protein [Clostridiaceae bacterium]|jgi:type IV pilus assembly protein PilC|nr:type II secretion system F family protein [Oscillospiraceae bacterium]NLO62950.1 type II secretion system F family protein [Clostridiaceae bacterium]
MPNFKYEVVDAQGRMTKGIIEAASVADATKMLRADGKFVSSLAQDTGASILNKSIGSPKLKVKDLLMICRQLSSLLGAGITIIRALDMLYQQMTSRKAKDVIGSIYEGIQAGKTLSEAFRDQKKALPDIMISMIAAGEESGRLDEVMSRLATHFEKEAKLKNKVAAAMIYPAILAFVTFAITIGLMVFVVPQFAKTLEQMDTKLPAITQVVMGMSNTLVNYWYIFVALIVALVLFFRSFKKSEKGGLMWDRFKLKVPILGKSVKATASARFTRTMSTLLRSGINVLESMEITSRTLGNRFLEKKLYESRNDIRKGSSISRSIRGISEFPPMIYAMTAIGEESGTLDAILDKAADYFEEEADAATTKLTAAMEPVMIIIMAVVVFLVVGACGAPILSMTAGIM